MYNIKTNYYCLFINKYQFLKSRCQLDEDVQKN
jgi:hypothetical protein